MKLVLYQCKEATRFVKFCFVMDVYASWLINSLGSKILFTFIGPEFVCLEKSQVLLFVHAFSNVCSHQQLYADT